MQSLFADEWMRNSYVTEGAELKYNLVLFFLKPPCVDESNCIHVLLHLKNYSVF